MLTTLLTEITQLHSECECTLNLCQHFSQHLFFLGTIVFAVGSRLTIQKRPECTKSFPLRTEPLYFFSTDFATYSLDLASSVIFFTGSVTDLFRSFLFSRIRELLLAFQSGFRKPKISNIFVRRKRFYLVSSEKKIIRQKTRTFFS